MLAPPLPRRPCFLYSAVSVNKAILILKWCLHEGSQILQSTDRTFSERSGARQRQTQMAAYNSSIFIKAVIMEQENRLGLIHPRSNVAVIVYTRFKLTSHPKDAAQDNTLKLLRLNTVIDSNAREVFLQLIPPFLQPWPHAPS